jgi:hypothetical protein
MTFEECAEHVGDAVSYAPRPDVPARPGVIRGMASLCIVDFTDFDGGTLQVNPFCLVLTSSATLF